MNATTRNIETAEVALKGYDNLVEVMDGADTVYEVEVIETVRKVYRVEAPKGSYYDAQDLIENAYYKGRLPKADHEESDVKFNVCAISDNPK